MIKTNLAKTFGWVLVLLSALVAGGVLYQSLVAVGSLQDKIAGATLACALVLIPLAIANAIEKITSK